MSATSTHVRQPGQPPIQTLARRASLLAAALLSLLVVVQNLASPPRKIVDWDTFGYYLYLTQALIAHDLAIKDKGHIQQIIDTHGLQTYLYQVNPLPNGNHAFKYSMGMAVLYSPAFLAGHLIAGWTGQPQDGFSAPYMHTLRWWSILVSLLGIWILRAALLRHMSEVAAALALALLLLGTNYWQNVTMDGGHTLSHNYLFTAYALLIWLTQRWYESPRWGRILPMGLVAGLVILARPTEMVCLLLPLLWPAPAAQGVRARLRFLVRHAGQVLGFALVVVLLGLPQLLYYHHVTGTYFYTEYGADAGEGFDWSHPHTWEVLVGFRKGWLVYSPMVVLALLGLADLFRRRHGLRWPILLYLATTVYFVSAWSCYWYAFCFGQRTLIPALAVLALPLGLLIDSLRAGGSRGRLRLGLLLGAGVALIGLNHFQTWQFNQRVLDPSRMTAGAYFKLFGATKSRVEARRLMLPKRGGNFDIDPEFPDCYRSRSVTKQDWEAQPGDSAATARPGAGCFPLHANQNYSPAIDLPYSALTTQDHCFVQFHARVRSSVRDSAAAPPALSMVTHYVHLGKVYDYRVSHIAVQAGDWQQISPCRISPEIRATSDSLRIYLMYHGPDTVWIDHTALDVWDRSPGS